MKKLAVIGFPIEHSLSPIIHKKIFLRLGEECVYEKISVKKEELLKFSEYARENLDGFNVTMPNKSEIIKYLDEISDDAKKYNSVNTVKVKNGKLLGFNTDADGYIKSLLKVGVNIKNKRFLIIGAGGAAETIVKRLLSEGVDKILILNRSLERAEGISKSTDQKTVIFDKLSYENLKKYAKECDVVLNATPLGMEGIKEDFKDFSFLESLKKNAVVSDLIYAPRETKLIKEAKKCGYLTTNGFDMLIYQALFSDEIYIEKKLDIDNIFEKVKAAF